MTTSETMNKDTLDRCLNLFHSISSSSLRSFIENMISQNKISSLFLTSPASVNHHHSEVGGLLTHSVEVAEMVANYSYNSTDERDIAVVAALFHDIGKVKVYETNGKLNKLGKLVSHDALTLEICSIALHQLDKDWPDAAITLRHIWTCASPGARYGNPSASYLTQIVRSADKISAERYMHNTKFIHSKNHIQPRITWHLNKYIWQPKQEQKNNSRRKIWHF